MSSPCASASAKTPVDSVVFSRAPMLVYWESTNACELSCAHCRAEAQKTHHPDTLGTAEVRAFFEDLISFDPIPRLVITGGDPLLRPDLIELVGYARGLGIDVAITPAGTPRLTFDVLSRLKDAGVSGVALSVDGSTPERHDALRRVGGSFSWTREGAKFARALDLPLQINTLVSKETLPDMPSIYEELQSWDIHRWSLFFLIPTGRGAALEEVSPEDAERFVNETWKLQRQAPFLIKTTEAHHVRRIAFQKAHARGMPPDEIRSTPFGRGFGIRDGNGIVFVSFRGNVSPSGFLPVVAGNIRSESVVQIYRDSRVFQEVRDVDSFKGKCGICEFRGICGGSRARAYAITGDYRESDSLCLYQP